jgi:hypothetical protein
MPNPTHTIYEKSSSEAIPWSQRVQYTFQEHDRSRSTEEVRAYRLPHSEGVFWTDFRIMAFHINGVSYTEPIQAHIELCTTEGESLPIIPPWKSYPPHRWWSTRWAIPALSFTAPAGVWIYVRTSDQNGHEPGTTYRVELQGFQNMYPLEDRYLLIDEKDRRQYLFQTARPVASCEEYRRPPPTGEIHDIYSEEQGATHGISPTEAYGVALFPIWTYVRQVVQKAE